MVIDYIKYMTLSVPVRVYEATTPARIRGEKVDGPLSEKDRDAAIARGEFIPAKVRYITVEATYSALNDEETVKNGKDSVSQRVAAKAEKGEELREMFAGSLPLYIGVGLRVRAEFKSVGGSLKVSGLPGLSAEASAGRVSGTLSLQTMGIGGKEITPLMPIPSDLSVASIQSAIQAAAAIKVKMYDEKTVVEPMIVGFESPVTEGDVVAELTSFVYGLNVRSELKKSALEAIAADKEHLWVKWPNGADRGTVEGTKLPEGPRSAVKPGQP
jgi:hypothetical protein